MKAPFGIAILSALTFLSGAALVLTAIFASFFIGLVHNLAGSLWLFTFFGSIVLIFVGLLGAATIYVAWGLWNGKSWAWWLALIITGLGIVVNIAALSFFAIVIDALIIAYLLKLTTEMYFSIHNFPISW